MAEPDSDTPGAGRPAPDADASTVDAASAPARTEAPSAPVPRQIGGYRIRQVLSSGGMGTVYVAVQENPRRTVAVKVMKRGIASRSALRRFEYESQILARLKHPYIAQVFEAGTHDDGSGGVPYFAMEYVPNAKTITEYAAAKSLGTRERLALIAKVCEAVHHGHTKGIIHRDLKPGNILVDAHGNPKIIDFGVARATDSDLAVTTLQTDIGQLIGTLQYMSPEQCEADPHDIDTRSDVYALGVVLYELLTERLPYDVSRAAIHEAARIIREEPPARPSTLDKTLRGDVETIALKALDKERERRYRSAEALADDVGRYLRNEPILARRPSVAYQLSRFAQRHRGLVTATVIVFALLVAGITVTSGLWATAVEEKERADRAAAAAKEAEAVSDIKLIDDYAAEADTLWPAHPEAIDDLDAWLTKARALVERLPGHEAELAAVRTGAIPRTPEEAAAERASHPKRPALQTAQARLAWLRRTLACRAGEAVEPALEPDWESLPEDAAALNEIARPLVDPERTSFGDDARALAIACRAAERAPDDAAVLQTLAFALLANGLDAEAEETASRAVAVAPEDEREQYEASVEKVREAVAEYRGPEGLGGLRERIAEVEAEVETLEEQVAERRAWRFADTSAQWRHDVLAELVDGLRVFGAPETGTVADVAARLTFARTIEERTTTGPDVRAAWSRAIASIADRAACPLYDGLVITPQLGLVPLDRNPETGLWEFWHVQTGARPEPNPDWPGAAPNRWIITGETGLVFVLIPGGTFRMGAAPPRLGVETEETPEGRVVTAVTADTLAERLGMRDGDVLRVVNGTPIKRSTSLRAALRTVVTGAIVTATVLRDGAEIELTATAERGVDSPNIDPNAESDEAPVHAVTLDPHFLSKYEMTQGQWQRFVGENPSKYAAGERIATRDITAANPVEQVSWDDVDRTTRRLDLLLPTEAQWEHAGRAGTASVWHTGGEPGTLQGYANIADEGIAGVVPASWVLTPGIDDGFAVHAPAGSFRPNRFGLHDVHGNVWEWCRDRSVGYGTAPRPGDGLRDDPRASDRVFRGGSFSNPSARVRSANRYGDAPSYGIFVLGLRPSRVVAE